MRGILKRLMSHPPSPGSQPDRQSFGGHNSSLALACHPFRPPEQVSAEDLQLYYGLYFASGDIPEAVRTPWLASEIGIRLARSTLVRAAGAEFEQAAKSQALDDTWRGKAALAACFTPHMEARADRQPLTADMAEITYQRIGALLGDKTQALKKGEKTEAVILGLGALLAQNDEGDVSNFLRPTSTREGMSPNRRVNSDAKGMDGLPVEIKLASPARGYDQQILKVTLWSIMAHIGLVIPDRSAGRRQKAAAGLNTLAADLARGTRTGPTADAAERLRQIMADWRTIHPMPPRLTT
jgi:hypothetical protein